MTGTTCGHDEAELRAAATQLAKAQDEVDEARASLGRAEAVEWGGPAAAAFGTSTAAIAARLAALAAGLAGLAMVAAALQADSAACSGLPGARGPVGAPASGPAWLVAGRPVGPIAPLPAPTPALRLETPSGPAFTRGSAGPSAGPGPADGAACR
ncbi:hypothetical protein RBS60_03590 [Sinomonas sp. ASV486]|uniref:hypothetical protein n=1 Tax=Sinomonas sp. ASV486 TaxID=3051170 RepID=UPI0027DC90E7|nr:hypothetical protein [Sinomonas sp. ASV486]MDQ4489279.1 hypothetical protein [Sinomonas sp. ASV486]